MSREEELTSPPPLPPPSSPPASFPHISLFCSLPSHSGKRVDDGKGNLALIRIRSRKDLKKLVECKQQGEGEGGGEGEAITGAGNRLLSSAFLLPSSHAAAAADLGRPPLPPTQVAARCTHVSWSTLLFVCHSFLVCSLLDFYVIFLFVCCLFVVYSLFLSSWFVCCLFSLFVFTFVVVVGCCND